MGINTSTISPYTNPTVVREASGESYLLEYPQDDAGQQLYNPILATHIVKEGETLQSIAYQYYGDSGYWYRLVAFNNIINPFELKPFTRIFIPE